jgi:hypothetical protein
MGECGNIPQTSGSDEVWRIARVVAYRIRKELATDGQPPPLSVCVQIKGLRANLLRTGFALSVV